jgi:altered-inheritance-of-mitochondria protein 5
MSFLLGTTAGALVAGGVYYGFSNLVHGRTVQHQAECVRSAPNAPNARLNAEPAA